MIYKLDTLTTWLRECDLELYLDAATNPELDEELLEQNSSINYLYNKALRLNRYIYLYIYMLAISG